MKIHTPIFILAQSSYESSEERIDDPDSIDGLPILHVFRHQVPATGLFRGMKDKRVPE